MNRASGSPSNDCGERQRLRARDKGIGQVVMLSTLRRFGLRDRRGQLGKIRDVIVDVSAGDYPPVTHLLYRLRGAGQPQRVLPWGAVGVSAADWRSRCLQVESLEGGAALEETAIDHAVLLHRDILDALVLDLQMLGAMRANDLWLHYDNDDGLCLRAVDAGPWALFRRLGRGWLGRDVWRDLHDWKDIEFLRGDPRAAEAGGDYHRRVERLPTGQIARLMEALPYLHAAELLTLLPDQMAADTLQRMSPERQVQVFEEHDHDHGVHLLHLMAPDLAAALLARLQPESARRYLEQVPRRSRERILELLQYPADSAGGLMTNDVVMLSAHLTVAEARQVLRERLTARDFVHFVYVVESDETRRLRGVLSLRQLLVAGDERPLEEVMRRHLLTINPHEGADAAALRVVDSHLAALPVVGNGARLLGVVTVDTAVMRVAPPSWSRQATRVFS